MQLRVLLMPTLAEHVELPAQARLFELLASIQSCGSLQRAASELGLSYRHAWGLVKSWEAQLRQPLLVSARGRGAALTEVGQRLVEAERALHEDVAVASRRWNARLAQVLASGARIEPAGEIAVAGGFDPVLATLAEQPGPLRWQLRFCSAIEALASLHGGQVQLAGFALADVHGRGSLAHVLMRRWLRPADVQLLRMATRQQGLVLSPRVPPGVAAGLRGLAGVSRARLRIVNRQRSSNARWLLDALMSREGLYPPDLTGYEDMALSEETALERLVDGLADVVLGTQTMAARHRLRFVPITAETYWLAFRVQDHAQPWLRDVCAYFHSESFRQKLDAHPGYGTERSGATYSPKIALPW